MKISSISLPTWVLIAAILGLAVGVFFGDYTAVLEPVGTLYVMLLESVVFPYIVCSLVHGLGSLEPATAMRLFKRGWMFFVLAWAITFGAIFIKLFHPSSRQQSSNLPNRGNSPMAYWLF